MKIEPVVRGAELPSSVSPGKRAAVQVTINPALTGEPVTFEVVSASSESGTATIVGDPQLYASGVIEVQAGEQTVPGHAEGLRIRAIQNGQPIAESSPFSVCAHPEALEYGFLGPAQVPLAIGMRVSVSVVSDSGDTAHLNEVVEKELVSDACDHSANLGGVPKGRPNQNVEFKPADTVPPDSHTIPVAQALLLDRDRLHGASGSWANDQLDLFQCRRCGMKHPAPIHRSGYRITRTVYTEKGQLRATVRKEPRDVAIDNITAAAGPSEVIELTLQVPPYPHALPQAPQ